MKVGAQMCVYLAFSKGAGGQELQRQVRKPEPGREGAQGGGAWEGQRRQETYFVLGP